MEAQAPAKPLAQLQPSCLQQGPHSIRSAVAGLDDQAWGMAMADLMSTGQLSNGESAANAAVGSPIGEVAKAAL